MTNLKNQETNLQHADTLRKCKVCGDYMISGHIEDAMVYNYYCRKVTEQYEEIVQ